MLGSGRGGWGVHLSEGAAEEEESICWGMLDVFWQRKRSMEDRPASIGTKKEVEELTVGVWHKNQRPNQGARAGKAMTSLLIP